jgi:hypothetical protein
LLLEKLILKVIYLSFNFFPPQDLSPFFLRLVASSSSFIFRLILGGMVPEIILFTPNLNFGISEIFGGDISPCFLASSSTFLKIFFLSRVSTKMLAGVVLEEEYPEYSPRF